MSERTLLTGIYILTYISILYAQIILPKTSKKNIFLGVKVPEDVLESEGIKNIYSRYVKSNILFGGALMIVLVLLSYFYYDNFLLIILSPFAFMAFTFAIYLKFNREVKELKAKEHWVDRSVNKRVVKIDPHAAKRENIFQWALFPIFVTAINILFMAYTYSNMPDVIPVHWGISGEADGFANKSFFSVFGISITQVIMIGVFYMSYYSMDKSRYEIDFRNPEASIERHRLFKLVWNRFFKISLSTIVTLFTGFNLATAGYIKNMNFVGIALIIVSVIIVIVNIRISKKYGQSGERIVLDDEEVIRDDYNMEDDELWIFGNSIYYNPDDPSLFVEKRVGVGWTVNAGRTIGKLIYLTMILIPIGSIALVIYLGGH